MSLVIVSKVKEEKLTDFFLKIENETGVKIESSRRSDGDWKITKILFADGKYVSSFYINYLDIGLPDYDTSYEAFIDTNTHLFVLMNGTQMSNVYDLTAELYNVFRIFVADINEDVGPEDIVSNIAVEDAFNFAAYARDDKNKQTIKILPAFCYCSKNSVPYAFLKNVFINYERRFFAGLKFVDQNNNEFVTLGSYFLYYNGKHK